MAERGAKPNVHPVRRKALDAISAFFTPLLPDDYLELINPLWSTQELRGRIERLDKEAGDAVTVTIRPGARWEGHKPGQYLRVGVIVDGKHHWRAYSLTSDPDREDGQICITPKLVKEGTVSPYFVEQVKPGSIVRLGGVEGDFVLDDPPPEKILFVSAGSGITPIMSMLRHLDHEDALADVVHLHSARTRDDVTFGDRLDDLDDRRDGYRLHLQLTGEMGRMGPEDLDELCPDWKEREIYVSGPGEMIDAFEEHYDKADLLERLHLERFQPKLGTAEEGEGGTIKFCKSDAEAESDGSQPILVAGEEAGLELPFGCREGVCHTCVGTLRSGQVRDLRNGKVHGGEGETVRTCINAPEGPVEIEL
jgi:stearoyl-CoA 9-desaturase NADPH oxidoreductase